MSQLIDSVTDLVPQSDGSSIISRVTNFSAEFLDSLKSERHASVHLRAGEMSRVASVPTQVADIWLAQGFDIYRESPKAIVARLKAHNLEAFITTSKSL